AEDPYGNIDMSYSGDRNIIFSDASSIGIYTPTVTDKNGGAQSFGDSTLINFSNGRSSVGGLMTLYKAESSTIHAVDADTTSITSTGNNLPMTVLPATATKFVILDPTTGTVDAAIPVTVQVQDQFGNLVNNYTNDVTLNVNGSATGAGIINIVGGTATVGITDHVAQTVHLSLTDSHPTGLNTDSNQDVIFAPGAVSYLAVTGDPSMTAGGTLNTLMVTAYDAYGNRATQYTGPHNLIFFGPQTAPDGISIPKVGVTDMGLSQSVGFTAGETSLGALSLVAYKAQSTTVDVQEGALTSAGHGLPLRVDAAAADSLVFLQGPSNTIRGVSISPEVTVSVKDVYHNVRTQDNSTDVTLAMGTNPLGGTLLGTLTARSSGGVATFHDLNINKVGVGYTLMASSGALTQVMSNIFNIETPVDGTAVWTGRVSSDPNNLNNWDGGVVPGVLNDVIIGASAHPMSLTGDFIVGSLTIDAGQTLTTNDYHLSVKNNLTVAGELNAGSSVVTVNGNFVSNGEGLIALNHPTLVVGGYLGTLQNPLSLVGPGQVNIQVNGKNGEASVVVRGDVQTTFGNSPEGFVFVNGLLLSQIGQQSIRALLEQVEISAFKLTMPEDFGTAGSGFSVMLPMIAMNKDRNGIILKTLTGPFLTRGVFLAPRRLSAEKIANLIKSDVNIHSDDSSELGFSNKLMGLVGDAINLPAGRQVASLR
ncbi:MAG: hypothetical protein HQL15_10900, partial [Candidatus Omnitrophica bacterium]|nr:hypothetical protein [Candidatus Omnitrophota bacterium]